MIPQTTPHANPPTFDVFSTVPGRPRLFTAEGRTLKEAVQSALQRGWDLSTADLRKADLSGLSLRNVTLRGVNLTGANLDDTDLTGANLDAATLQNASLRRTTFRFTRLEYAVLIDTDLEGATFHFPVLNDTLFSHNRFAGADLKHLTHLPVPVVPGLHRKVADAVSDTALLDMDHWHCGSAHCWAGWIVTLAGADGQALEAAVGTSLAATLIVLASDPEQEHAGRTPDFLQDKHLALADIHRLAGRTPGAAL